MIPGLHADHVDTSGAYGQKFAVVEDLLSKGMLKEIPEEFRDKGTASEEVPVITTSQTVVGNNQNPEWDMSREHADHVDASGEYARVYMERFGVDSLNGGNEETITPEQHETASSWKSFLKDIIAEEKSKLKV